MQSGEEESKEPKSDSDKASAEFASSEGGENISDIGDGADFLDDVFNQLGGFDVGDYGDEDGEEEKR